MYKTLANMSCFAAFSVISLNKENVEIDTKITTLQSEKTIISEVEVERREQTEDLEEILGGVDTTFIDKAGLSDGSIISAKSAHTETLKIYSGARVDKIIKESIEKGLFEVEVFDLTDIEAKLLLDGGYLLLYAYELIFKKPLPSKIQTLLLKFGFIFLLMLMFLITAFDLGF